MKTKGTKKGDKKKTDNRNNFKKLRTFNSSEFSFIDDPHQSSFVDLSIFKNQSIAKRKYQSSSALSQYGSIKSINSKLTNKKKKKTAKTKHKSKQKYHQEEQQYEKVKYKASNTNSEIVFSADETKRESLLKDFESNKIVTMNPHRSTNLKNQMNENFILRINIRKDYLKKKQAAIKIQKVWRGYMTRRILMKYIIEEEEKILNSSSAELEGYNRIRPLNDRFVEQLFPNRENISRFQQENSAEKTFRDSDNNNHSLRQYMQNNPPMFPLNDPSANHPKAQISQGESLSSSQNHEGQSQETDSQNQIMYRHQQPIYSHEDISNFLSSSDSEAEQSNDGYDPQILFETIMQSNEEYLESRKSSMQNKNETINKLSQGHQQIVPDIMRLDKQSDQVLFQRTQNKVNNEEPKISSSECSEKKEENYLKNGLKTNIEEELNQPDAEDKKDAFSKGEDQNQPHNKRPIILNLKTIQDKSISRSSSSRSNNSNQEVLRLREKECQRWEEVIRMINSQIKLSQDSNGEIIDFMKTIIQYSQKNKELLGSTRSINLEAQHQEHTTPTSFSHVINEYEMKGQEQKNEEQVQGKIFKKKGLRIEIADSAFTAQEKQKLFTQFEGNDQKRSHQLEKNSHQINNEKHHCNFSNYLMIQQEIRKSQSVKEKHQTNWHSISNPNQIKNFLSSNMHDETIEEILKVREQLLQNKQSQQLLKLNEQLSSGQLSQDEFIQKLSYLSSKFKEQKEAIDKVKSDIIKGYQAANSLIKDYFFDIKRMGFKLPVSRSQESLKCKSKSFMIDHIHIDEVSPRSNIHPEQVIGEIKKNDKKNQTKKGVFFNEDEIYQSKSGHEKSGDNSQIDFSEEELQRFRKAANYDLDLNQLNTNMAISEDFVKKQTKSEEPIESPLSIQRQTQPTRQFYLVEDRNQSMTPQKHNPQVQAIVDFELEKIIWEVAFDIVIESKISQKLIDRDHSIRPQSMTDDERLRFIEITQNNLSEISSLNRKLNQKITPLPAEILKCMRLDFSEEPEEQEEQNYEQISKYQFVLSQQICTKSVVLFKQEIDNNNQNAAPTILHELSLKEINNICPIPEKVEKYLNRRENFLKNRKQHTQELRWEVINIQIHCLFDSWNQQIIQLCSQRQGFSGIGLNELTLSLIDHNKQMKLEETPVVIKKAKQKVISIIFDDTELNAKILRQNFYEMAENDSAWILYSDQALSYALELVYLMEQQLYEEATKQLKQIMEKD